MSDTGDPLKANGSPRHAIPEDEALETLKDGRDGLTDAEAGRRLGEYGRNEPGSEESAGLRRLVLGQPKSPLMYLSSA